MTESVVSLFVYLCSSFFKFLSNLELIASRLRTAIIKCIKFGVFLKKSSGIIYKELTKALVKTRANGEARNLQVGGHVAIFQFFWWAQTQKFQHLTINLHLFMKFSKFLVGSYSGFATAAYCWAMDVRFEERVTKLPQVWQPVVNNQGDN